MAEPEEIVTEKQIERKRVSDFINIVKALRILVPKEEFPYGRINKLFGMVQRHGDCFCEDCQEKRKSEGQRFSRSLSKIAQYRQEYYEAGRAGEFEQISKVAKKGVELLFSLQKADLDDAELLRAIIKIYRKKVIFI
jgi:hypothetical protein